MSAVATSAVASGSGLPSIGLVPGWLTTAAHWWGQHGLLISLREHVLYTLIAVVIAIIIAVPLGLLVGHTGRGIFVVAGLANAIRAVPALGLLILLYVLVTPKIHYRGSIGWLFAPGALGSLIPVEAMLVVLAIPAILTNTYAGVQSVDPDVRDAAKGMGMRAGQIVRQVEFPNALPLIFAGIRSAVLQVIATATIAGYLPFMGGLGYTIFQVGLPSITSPEVGYPAMIGAALLVAALAVVADLLLMGLQRTVVSPGVSGRFRTRATPRPAPIPQPLEVAPNA
jgi:osmoprotectant transport system permease protein